MESLINKLTNKYICLYNVSIISKGLKTKDITWRGHSREKVKKHCYRCFILSGSLILILATMAEPFQCNISGMVFAIYFIIDHVAFWHRHSGTILCTLHHTLRQGFSKWAESPLWGQFWGCQAHPSHWIGDHGM